MSASAVPALSYLDPDRYVQQMLDGVLGSGMSSRLFVEIREKRALAYSVGSYVQNYRDVGGFIVYAAVDNERVDSCLEGVLHELDRVRQEPVPRDRAEQGQGISQGPSAAGAGEQPRRGRLGRAAGVAAGPHLERGRGARADRRSDARRVQAMAQRLFQDQVLSLGVVGPFADEDAFRELLALR